jgi:DNA-binding transcriptional LysR family regulator
MIDYSREFIVLVSHMSFTTAARELNMSQPSLSRHITELEKELGFELITRDTVALTAAGRYYMEQISTLLGDFDRAVKRGRDIAKKSHGKITIWQPPLEGRAAQIFYEASARLHRIEPFLEIEYKSGRNYSVYQALSNGSADVGISYYEKADLPENITRELLTHEAFSVLMKNDNPLAAQESFTMQDLVRYYLAFSTNKRNEEWNQGTLDIFRREGVEPKVRMKDYNSLSEFFSGFGVDEISLISPVMASFSAAYSSFVALRPKGDHPLHSYTYILRKKSEPDSSIELFANICKEVALEDFRGDE